MSGKAQVADVGDRFLARVLRDEATGCWLWTRQINSSGYAQFWVDGKRVYAHRWSYEWFIEPIPEGLTIDHLCRVHNCVNPSHLEAVTNRENLLRGTGLAGLNAVKTHCRHGHEYTPENTRVRVGEFGTYRACRTCELNRNRRYRCLAAIENPAPVEEDPDGD